MELSKLGCVLRVTMYRNDADDGLPPYYHPKYPITTTTTTIW